MRAHRDAASRRRAEAWKDAIEVAQDEVVEDDAGVGPRYPPHRRPLSRQSSSSPSSRRRRPSGATPRCAWRRSTPHGSWSSPSGCSPRSSSPRTSPHTSSPSCRPRRTPPRGRSCRAWRRGWKDTLKKRERPRLLVIGSEDNNGEFLHSIERYDPSTNEWRRRLWRLRHEGITVRTAVLDGKLYAAGGRNEAAVSLNLVERYDFATKRWEAVAPMATPHVVHALSVLDGKLYAAGGQDANYHTLSSVERNDPAVDAWEAVAPMGEERSGPGVAVLDGKLYAVGGLDSGYNVLSSVERYDPALDAWEAVAPMAEARFYPTAAVAVRRGRPEARPQPRLPQLGRAVRSDNQRVGGGGGADDVGADEWFRCLLDVVLDLVEVREACPRAGRGRKVFARHWARDWRALARSILFRVQNTLELHH